MEGDLPVADVPGAWNERFERDFGLKPPDDTHGCLQDVHWSAGLIGYFPTYTLGNLYAAQFFEAARRDLGDPDRQFAEGGFSPLLGWLRDRIHRQGKRYTAPGIGGEGHGKTPGPPGIDGSFEGEIRAVVWCLSHRTDGR